MTNCEPLYYCKYTGIQLSFIKLITWQIIKKLRCNMDKDQLEHLRRAVPRKR